MASALGQLFDLGLEDKDLPVDTHFLQGLLDQMGAASSARSVPVAVGHAVLLHEDLSADTGYFLSEDKSLLFILVEPPEGLHSSFVGDREAIEAIRGAVARLRRDFPNVRAGVTGAPALSNDEMSSAFHDSQRATILAFALTSVVMMVAFVRVGKPLLMLGVLVVTLGWSMGIITLAVGHLTLFSVMFIPIVIGVGIDYGNYYLFRYEEEMLLGRKVREALERTGGRTGPGMLLGALTAAGTFLVLLLTDFRGIQELGLIAGISILLAWLGMMTLLPALLVLVDLRHAAEPRDREVRADLLKRIRVPVLDHLTGYSKTILVAAAIATALSAWAVREVGFDYNVLNLQAKGTESVAWEKRILATTGRSGFNALSSAVTLDELRRKQEAFERLASVSQVDSVLRVIPDDQAAKIAIIKSFAPLVDPVRIGRSSPVDLDRLTKALADIRRRLDMVAAEAGEKLPADVQALRHMAATVLDRLNHVDRESAEAALTYFQAQLYRDFVGKFHSLQRNTSPTAMTIEDVPEEVARKFIGRDDRFLIQIHPKVDIWEKQGAAQFVRDLRSVDPEVTGSPIITYEATMLMERAYLQGTAYAFILVAGLSLLMIRRVRETLLALLPLTLGVLWTIGLMHVFGIRFNLANIWGLPLIIGTSAEFGLNVMLRYMEGRAHRGPLVARSTVMAVALNGLVMMVGFGCLMVASHQGIWSLGLLLTIGSGCNLLASLVVLPVVLTLLTRQPAVPTVDHVRTISAG